jgi:cycloeucalenol cycloisomerase
MKQTRSRLGRGSPPVISHRRPGRPISEPDSATVSSSLLSDPTRFYLLYTPVWIAAVAVVLLQRAFSRWGDPEYLLFGGAIAAPIWLWPLWAARRRTRSAAVSVARQGAKLALFVTLLSFLQNYFGTPFFARSFGLEYRFPARIALNGYPVFLSLLTVAYFGTYFAVMGAGLRLVERVSDRFLPPSSALRLLRRLVVTFVLAYAMAFLETLTMATDLLAGYFAYASKARMLAVGSLCYGTLLFCAQLAYLRIDEARPEERSTGQVVWDALAVSMLVLSLYELFAYLLARFA